MSWAFPRKKNRLSRLNSKLKKNWFLNLFCLFSNIWVEPAQPDFSKKKRVEPAQPEFWKRTLRIWYMFLISKCRGEWDPGLCMTLGLARGCRCAVPTSDFWTCLTARFVGSRHCAAVLFLQVLKSCIYLDPTLLYISISGTHSKFVRINKMLSLGICLLQPSWCPSAGRRFAASRSRLNYSALRSADFRLCTCTCACTHTISLSHTHTWATATEPKNVLMSCLPSVKSKQRYTSLNIDSSLQEWSSKSLREPQSWYPRLEATNYYRPIRLFPQETIW